jgi:hypothetical protein
MALYWAALKLSLACRLQIGHVHNILHSQWWPFRCPLLHVHISAWNYFFLARNCFFFYCQWVMNVLSLGPFESLFHFITGGCGQWPWDSKLGSLTFRTLNEPLHRLACLSPAVLSTSTSLISTFVHAHVHTLCMYCVHMHCVCTCTVCAYALCVHALCVHMHCVCTCTVCPHVLYAYPLCVHMYCACICTVCTCTVCAHVLYAHLLCVHMHCVSKCTVCVHALCVHMHCVCTCTMCPKALCVYMHCVCTLTVCAHELCAHQLCMHMYCMHTHCVCTCTVYTPTVYAHVLYAHPLCVHMHCVSKCTVCTCTVYAHPLCVHMYCACICTMCTCTVYAHPLCVHMHCVCTRTVYAHARQRPSSTESSGWQFWSLFYFVHCFYQLSFLFQWFNYNRHACEVFVLENKSKIFALAYKNRFSSWHFSHILLWALLPPIYLLSWTAFCPHHHHHHFTNTSHSPSWTPI